MKNWHSTFKRLLPLLPAAVLVLAGGCGDSADELVRRAHDEAAAGRWDQALAPAEQAVRKAPESVPALIMRALACEQNGKPDPALDSARQAVKLNPESFTAQYTLGRLYAQDPARRQDALTPLYKAAQLKPDDRNTRILLANVLTALNNYDQALPYLQELSRDPQLLASAGMQGIFGNYYFRKRNFRAANQAFTAAYNQSPRDPLTIYNAAVSRDFYYNRDQGRTAQQLYRQFLAIAESQPELAGLCEQVRARLARLAPAAR